MRVQPFCLSAENAEMKLTASQIRLWNARYLSNDSISGMAEKIGKSQSQTGQFIGINPTRNIGNKIARQIESIYGKPEGWLDQARPLEWMKIKRPEWRSELSQINEEGAQYIVDMDEAMPHAEPLDMEQQALIEAWQQMSETDRDQLLQLAQRFAETNPIQEQKSIDASQLQGDSDELRSNNKPAKKAGP